MMIIGKYFKTNKNYINVMKVSRKYHDLTQMYHFNPISDCSIFSNIETQHLYKEQDRMEEEIKRHVYWYQVDYEKVKKGDEKDEYKLIELKTKKTGYSIPIENGKCIIPSGVTSIGTRYYYQCTQLMNIELPTTLRNIGHYSFSKSNITMITIPEGVSIINKGCFSECSLLTNIELPTTLIVIGDESFSKTNITTITIPEGVTSIGDSCFL